MDNPQATYNGNMTGNFLLLENRLRDELDNQTKAIVKAQKELWDEHAKKHVPLDAILQERHDAGVIAADREKRRRSLMDNLKICRDNAKMIGYAIAAGATIMLAAITAIQGRP